MKSRTSVLVGCVIVMGLLSACSINGNGKGVKGSGVVKTETRDVRGFRSIQLSSLGSVTVTQTGRESLTIQAEDNLLPLLESSVKDGVLYLATIGDTNISPTETIRYEVEVRDLQGVNITGAGSVHAANISTRQMSVDLSGVGNVEISGSTETLNVALSGVGNFEGSEFLSEKATVDDSGVGHAIVNVSDQLDVTVSGIGSVEYIGSPVINQSVSGIGKVSKH